MARDVLKTYGTQGPLGFPMLDKQALAVDALLKTLPSTKEYEYRKSVHVKAPTELNPGERSDVSWISTETPDLAGDVVFAKGMDDSKFAMNPIVTYGHCYQEPPIGRSLWRKAVKDGSLRGIKAKTIYPPMPASWNQAEVWKPDQVFSMIQAGLLNGKSIGWLPVKTHYADMKEANKLGCHEGSLIIEEWLLLEYAVCALPMNPDAIVQEVAKSGESRVASLGSEKSHPAEATTLIKFTSLEEIQRAMEARIGIIDLRAMTRGMIDRMRGRI